MEPQKTISPRYNANALHLYVGLPPLPQASITLMDEEMRHMPT